MKLIFKKPDCEFINVHVCFLQDSRAWSGEYHPVHPNWFPVHPYWAQLDTRDVVLPHIHWCPTCAYDLVPVCPPTCSYNRPCCSCCYIESDGSEQYKVLHVKTINEAMSLFWFETFFHHKINTHAKPTRWIRVLCYLIGLLNIILTSIYRIINFFMHKEWA